jgi:VCBS repeat-containing protein
MITVNITGTNDIATVSSATMAVKEGNDSSALNASGKLIIVDADAGEALVVAKDVTGTYGTFHVLSDGTWTYTGNGAHDELKEGQQVSDSITVKSVDGTGQGTITVNITGTNDIATVSSATTAVKEGNEAFALNTSGKLVISDADAGQAQVIAKNVAGTYGTFRVNSDGSWTYTGSLRRKTATQHQNYCELPDTHQRQIGCRYIYRIGAFGSEKRHYSIS